MSCRSLGGALGYGVLEVPRLELITARVPTPARYDAPVGLAWTDPDRGPPLGVIHHALCVDAPGVRNAVEAQLAATPDAYPSDVVLDGPCADPGYCRWLGERATAEPPTLSSRWWVALGMQCRDDRSVVRLDGAGGAVWLYSLVTSRVESEPPVGFDPRIGTTTAERIAEGDPAARYGLEALSLAVEPEAERDLLALHRAVRGPWRDEIALSLWGARSPEGLAAFAQGREAHPDDPRATRTRRDPLALDVLFAHRDVGRRFSELPPAAVADALRTCVATSGIEGRRCARALIRHGDPVELDDPTYADLRLGVELGDQLDATLAVEGIEVPPGTTGTVADRLIAAGRATRLDDLLQTGEWQVRLPLAVAALASEPDLRFDVVLPSELAPFVEGRTPFTASYAWDGARRYRGRVEPDLPDTFGFVNAVLAARESRYVAVLDADWDTVIVLEQAALQSLVDQGLLSLADLSDVGVDEELE
ncbi:MAG: hypothetical protein ABMA64_31885 [Myxococcota bacterium]